MSKPVFSSSAGSGKQSVTLSVVMQVMLVPGIAETESER